MVGGQHGRDGFGEHVLGSHVVDERRTRQARVQATLAQPVDECGDRAVLGRQDQLGVGLRERPYQRGDDVVTDRRQVTDVDRLALAARHALDVVERPVGLVYQRTSLDPELLSDRREPHASRSAHEQRRSELPLERADLLGTVTAAAGTGMLAAAALMLPSSATARK